MNTLYLDPEISDDERRGLLYDGQLLAYSPGPSSLKLIELARDMAEIAFAPYDPRTAQNHLPVEEYTKVLGR